MADSWGAGLYGDPCRECGFDWTIPDDALRAALVGYPELVASALGSATGAERHSDLAWSVAEYVCHVGDNLRIWAERVGGALEGGGSAIGPYDENLLAEARNYPAIPLATAMRSLRRAAAEYVTTLDEAPATGVLLEHPDRGPLTRTDVLHANAHDALHHVWDVRRILAT